MLNHSASLPMSTSVLKALPGKLDIKRHKPGILYFFNKCYSGIFSEFLQKLIRKTNQHFKSDYKISRLHLLQLRRHPVIIYNRILEIGCPRGLEVSF